MKRFLVTLMALPLMAGTWQDMEEEEQDDKDVVAAAAKKLTEAENYSFKGTLLVDTPSFGGGGDEEPEPSKFEGKHGEEGSIILTDTSETVKYKGKTATRPRAEWRVVEENEEGGRGGRGGRRGRRGGMGRMFAGRMALPHEDLKGFGDKIEKIENTEKTEMVGETDCTVYKGTFTDKAAEAMMPNNRMLERLEDVDISCKVTVWLDAEGNIHKYKTALSLAAGFNGNDFEIGIDRTVSVYAIGSTKVKIPADAKKAIDKGKDEDY